MSDYTRTQLPQIDKPVHRMGLAGNYGVTSDDVRFAADQGVNYWVYGMSYRKVTDGIADVIGRDRDAHVVSYLGGVTAFAPQVRRQVEGALRKLKTDYLDCYQLGWLGTASRMSPAIVEMAQTLQAEGKIRTFGCSIHDRPRAGKLAAEGPVDLLMIRYSAKHPGAEQDIFPHTGARNPAVIAYTALAWGQLIKPVKGLQMPPYPGDASVQPPLTPAQCYRFVLNNPHVHVVLTGPQNREQLVGNLQALADGPLSEQEMEWVRAYGQKVRGAKKMDFV